MGGQLCGDGICRGMEWDGIIAERRWGNVRNWLFMYMILRSGEYERRWRGRRRRQHATKRSNESCAILRKNSRMPVRWSTSHTIEKLSNRYTCTFCVGCFCGFFSARCLVHFTAIMCFNTLDGWNSHENYSKLYTKFTPGSSFSPNVHPEIDRKLLHVSCERNSCTFETIHGGHSQVLHNSFVLCWRSGCDNVCMWAMCHLNGWLLWIQRV